MKRKEIPLVMSVLVIVVLSCLLYYSGRRNDTLREAVSAARADSKMWEASAGRCLESLREYHKSMERMVSDMKDDGTR